MNTIRPKNEASSRSRIILSASGCPFCTGDLTSVSGGSILNGFLGSRLPVPLSSGIEDFDNSVSKPLRDFCSLDIRRWLALEAVVPGTHNSEGLAKQYDQHLTLGKKLDQIPGSPVHIFCATDLAYGVNWMFKKEECGDYEAGFQNTPDDWLVSTAVAASSCFPPVFNPISLNLDPAKLTGGRIPPSHQRDNAEASVLENHRYWLADAAIRKHATQLLPQLVPPLRVPNPDWEGPEEKILEALKDSGKRRLLGHWSDDISSRSI